MVRTLATCGVVLALLSCDDDGGPAGIGQACGSDSDCASGACYESDFDLNGCYGSGCTIECLTDEECAQMAQEYGDDPEEGWGRCGDDGRCDLVESGVGDFMCAG